jgi:hypothetical protein
VLLLAGVEGLRRRRAEEIAGLFKVVASQLYTLNADRQSAAVGATPLPSYNTAAVGTHLVEHPLERRQAVLVHVVERRQLGDAEEQRRATRRHRAVAHARLVDLGRGGARHLELVGQLDGLGLGALQGGEELLVVQDVAWGSVGGRVRIGCLRWC